MDLLTVDLTWPGKIEIIQQLDHREARLLNAALRGAVLPHRGIAFDQTPQIIDMRPLRSDSLRGKVLVVLLDERQVQVYGPQHRWRQQLAQLYKEAEAGKDAQKTVGKWCLGVIDANTQVRAHPDQGGITMSTDSGKTWTEVAKFKVLGRRPVHY